MRKYLIIFLLLTITSLSFAEDAGRTTFGDGDNVFIYRDGNRTSPGDNLHFVDVNNTTPGITLSGILRSDAADTASEAITFTKQITVNEGSTDVDTRIESNGNENMIFVDAGNDRVGIGLNNPSVELEVNGDFKCVNLTVTGTETIADADITDLTTTNLIATNATITTIDCNGGAIDGTAIGANSASTGKFTSIDIDAGTIDGTTIGGGTPGAGTFTTLGSTGNATFNEDVYIGNGNNADDDTLYMDVDKYLRWNNSTEDFTFSNSLNISTGLQLNADGSIIAMSYVSGEQLICNPTSPSGDDLMLKIGGVSGESECFTVDAEANTIIKAPAPTPNEVYFQISVNPTPTPIFQIDGEGDIVKVHDITATGDIEGVNINATTQIKVGGSQITSSALSDVASIAMLDEAETIAADWVNTSYPWSDNEVSDALTIRTTNEAQFGDTGAPDSVVEISCGTSYGKQLVTLDGNDVDKGFIDYQGTAGAVGSANITTTDCDSNSGAASVAGPLASTWTCTGMVLVEINGTEYWMPYYYTAAPECPRLDAWYNNTWVNVGRVLYKHNGIEKDGKHILELKEPAKKFRIVEDEPENTTIHRLYGNGQDSGIRELITNPGDVYYFEFDKPVTTITSYGYYDYNSVNLNIKKKSDKETIQELKQEINELKSLMTEILNNQNREKNNVE